MIFFSLALSPVRDRFVQNKTALLDVSRTCTENVTGTVNLVPFVQFYNPKLKIIKESVSVLPVDIWRH